MPADLSTLFLLVLGEPQVAATAGWLAAFLAPALAIGRVLRRPTLEGAAFGVLTLTAAADGALYLLRAAALPAALHLPLTVALAAALAAILRRWVLPPPPALRRLDALDLALLALLAAAFWCLRIVQVDPSSGLSAQVGWVPQYLAASFEAGRFLLGGDFAFADGPASGLVFPVDMLGVAALAGGLRAAAFYPPYLATSILAVGLAVLLPLAALRGRRAAQLTYIALLAALLVADFQFRAAIARHWGDSVLILGGTVMMTALARRPASAGTLLAACCAASFLVLARHYGALYAALLFAAAALAAWWRLGRRALAQWPAALVLCLLVGVLSLREINYILHPETWYPGAKLLTLTAGGWRSHLTGALQDWGLITDFQWTPLGPRTAWLAALAALLAFDRGRCRRRPRRLVILLAPFAVMLLPAALEAITGYRSSGTTNKPYLLGVLFGAFYPAFAVAWLCRGGARQDAALRLGLTGIGAAAAAWVAVGPAFGLGPGRALAWARTTYDDRIVDRGIALALAESGAPTAIVAARPLLYFYFEPGIGLRNYIGGDIRADFDFWSPPVQKSIADTRDLGAVLAGLGWPNLYLSDERTYHDYVDGDSWRLIQPQLDAIESQPWVDRVIRYRDARLVVVKRP